MNWYYAFLIRRPYLMVLAIGILSVACVIVSITTKSMPDFSDPTLGFEARGTSLGHRLTAWHNLLQETTRLGKLVADPRDLPSPQEKVQQNIFRKLHKQKPKKIRKNKKKTNESFQMKLKSLKSFARNDSVQTEQPPQWNGDAGVFKDYEVTNDTAMEERRDHWEYGKNLTFVDEEDNQEDIEMKNMKWLTLKNSKPPLMRSNDMHVLGEGFFCDSPQKGYSHFVVERIGPNATDSLFNINSLLALCQLEEQIVSVPEYDEYCQKEVFSNSCCRSWSIPNYVALLSNKTSCFDIDQNDVSTVQTLLVNCFEYFLTLKLSEDCLRDHCWAPAECIKQNAVFNILQYLTDENFIKSNDSTVFLKYSMIFVPVAQTTKILRLFHNWEKANLKNEIVQVAAMNLGLKDALFDECLVTDGWLVVVGGVFIMVCMWLYTSSLFVTFMTIIAVLFSLGIGYFVYTIVFDMTFFPFMNLLAVVVSIGIGADDCFIFVKIWECTLAERIKKSKPLASPSGSLSETAYTDSMQSLMGTTLRHAALSMFVTSITTAGAFFASYVSSITAVKCFGLFAGTAVISNYLLMVTWLPASISIMDRIPFHMFKCISDNILQKVNKSINKFASTLEVYILNAVLNWPYLWILILGMIGLCSSVIVLYYPQLQLPESSDFQLFVSSHPFEIYDSKFKDSFWFEKGFNSMENFKLPLRFVWGIQPIDDGDYTNPFSRGELHFDNNFNISSVESQIWLLDFCKRLKQQPFYKPTLGVLLPNCFIENFISFMDRICIDTMGGDDRKPCCDISKFPFEPHVFEECLPKIISSLYATPRQFFIPGVAGPKFVSRTDGNVTLPPLAKALVVEVESNYSYSIPYSEMKSFISTVQTWFDAEMANATQHMSGGWFISDLEFFDLQDTLSKGTIIAIGMSMATALVVLLFCTFNVLISLYAVVTVTFTIFTTVAILICLGWKLNILESVSVSSAIGLAVDFSLHYGIHYRLAPKTDRKSATTFALSRIIGPTAMAAITTGFAGVLMLSSSVLPYIQIGIFLIVVTSVSWVYATFFLASVLYLIGPEDGFMQFNFSDCKRRPKKCVNGFYDRKESNVIASEQLLTPSSSAVGDQLNSESHELDSLASNSLIKPISECARPPFDYDRAFNRKSIN